MSNSHTAFFMSMSLHAGVAVVAYFGLPSLWKEPPTPIPSIMIEFVEVAEETRLAAPEKRKDTPEAAPQKTSQYAKAEASEPEAAADAIPTLEALKTPAPKPRIKPIVSKRQKLVSSVKPRSRPKPPSRFKSKKLAALIDRSIKDDSDVVEKPKEEAKKSEATAERPLFGSIRNKVATATVIRAFSQYMKEECFIVPAGAKGVQNMNVSVRIWLRRDRTLSLMPEVVDAGDMKSPVYRVFVESALRAIKQCEPYPERILPIEQYEVWKDMEILFDPSTMF